MEYKIKVAEKEHALDGQNKMNSFRKEKKHCDFTIKVESKEISVHRAVICSRSDYFDAMFSHDTKEKRIGVAEIKGVDRECTVKCVDFMYTGETSIKGDKCGELMHVATLFQLLTLCNAIAAFLEEKLDCESFFATKQLADLYSCQKLVNACNDFALKHFQEIAQLDDFKELDKEFIEFLITSKDIMVEEGIKLKSVMEWIKHDLSKRKTALLGFMKKMELRNISLPYRKFLLENEALVTSCGEIATAVGLSCLESMNVSSQDLSIEPKKDAGIAVFDQESKALQVFNVKDQTWSPKQALTNEMDSVTAVIVDQYLYVFSMNKTVHRISLSNSQSTWEQMATKNLKYGHAVVLNEMIYTCDYFERSNRAERFDTATNNWTLLPEKKLSVQGEAMAVAEGKIFCVGGFDGINLFSEAEVFDPTTSSWNIDSHLKKPRTLTSAASLENEIYVLGGFDGTHLCDVEYRCPRNKAWTVVVRMTVSRSFFSCCCIDGKIYAVGGGQSGEQTIEEFDPKINECKIIGRMGDIHIHRLSSIGLAI